LDGGDGSDSSILISVKNPLGAGNISVRAGLYGGAGNDTIRWLEYRRDDNCLRGPTLVMHMAEEPAPYLRAADAARRIGVAESTFRSWVHRRGLIKPVVLVDGSKRFRSEDVEWLREQVRRNDESR
jgi:hypothetical protein